MAELQDVFAQYGKTYRLNHNLLANQLKAMRAYRKLPNLSFRGS